MSLFDRINPEATNRIAVHRLGAAVGEYMRGKLDAQQVIDSFNLAPDEVSQLQSILTRISAGDISYQHVEDVFILVEMGDYTENKAKQSLGY